METFLINYVIVGLVGKTFLGKGTCFLSKNLGEEFLPYRL